MLSKKIARRWGKLRNNLEQWGKQFLNNEVGKLKKKRKARAEPIHVDNYHYETHRTDDLPLTLSKETGPGVTYNYTENSEFARGAEKSQAVGIDSFGEEDTFDPDVADEYQDYRNRNQNSDLVSRFFTDGMDIRKEDLDH